MMVLLLIEYPYIVWIHQAGLKKDIHLWYSKWTFRSLSFIDYIAIIVYSDTYLMATHCIHTHIHMSSQYPILHESSILSTNTWHSGWYCLYVHRYIIYASYKSTIGWICLCQGSTDSRTRVKRLRERKRGISLEETPRRSLVNSG